MIILKIAWKNIWRKKIRSLVVLMAIISGLSGGLVGVAFASGYVKQLVDSVVQMEASHIMMQADSFYINHDLCYYLNNTDELVNKLKSHKQIESASGRLKVLGNINSAHASAGVSLIGVNPETEKAVFRLHEIIPDSCGSYFNTNTRNPIIIGRALADNLNVDLNSRLVATFQSIDGELVSTVFRVAGIFVVDNKMFEKTEVFVYKEELAQLAGLDVDVSHEIAIKLSGNLSAVSNTLNNLENENPQYRFFPWYTLRPEVGILHTYIGLLIGILIGIILTALSLGILNTMLMVVLERRQEFGMLRAIGMNDNKVFWMVVAETVLLMITGAFISMIISWLIINWLAETGVFIGFSTASIFDTNGGLERLYPVLEWPQYIKVALMVIITGILSAIYPACKVLQMNPADAVRRLN